MAPVRSAFWDTPYVSLDHPRRPFLRREHCRLCPELSDRRRYRRCSPRMAAPGRRVVCAADSIPADKGVRPCIMEMWKTARSLRTFPQRLLLQISILSFPIQKRKKSIKKTGSAALGQTEKPRSLFEFIKVLILTSV